jgi:rod shape-determining protein MreD
MIRKILYWLMVLFLQLVVFNHLAISSYLIPQVFIILLITLPLHLNKLVQVFIAFGLGLLADMFVGTPGIHASACLWLVMLRMTLLAPQDLKEQISNRESYTVYSAGLSGFIYTTVILVLFYHLYVFWLESIGAINSWNLFITTLVSSLFVFTFIGISQFLSAKSIGE